LTTWFAGKHSALRWPPRLWLVVGLALLVTLVGALAPAGGVGSWLRLGAAAAVAGVGLLFAPRILRTVRG
ncbi:MAG: polysaccharide biosynthesis protein, partial [Terrabacter sp.]